MAEQTNQETALAQFTGNELALIKKIEDVVSNTEIALLGATGKITKTFALARGVQALKQYVTPEMMNTYVMPLMNTPLGFKTDKDPKRKVKKDDGQWVSPTPYPMEVVKDCVITVMLRGGQLVGNEFNIISGQAYFTKEYFQRVLGQIPDVTNIVPSPGIPKIEGKRALIRYGLSWKRKGVSDALRDADGNLGRVFEIRCDSYSSVDQIIGKADRKAYAAAYRQIMGSELSLPDGDADDIIEGQVVPPSAPMKSGMEKSAEAVAAAKAEAAAKADAAAKQKAAQAQKQAPPVVEKEQVKEPEPQPVVEDQPNVDADGVIQDEPSNDPPADQSNDQSDDQGQQEKQASDEDDVSTYELFYGLAENIAADKGVPATDFSRGLSMALIACGCKGKQDKTTIEWRKRILAALRNNKLDWQTGKVLP